MGGQFEFGEMWGWSKNTKFLQIIGCFSPKPPKSADFDPPHELTEFRIELGGSNSPNSEFGDLKFGGDKVGTKWIPP